MFLLCMKTHMDGHTVIVFTYQQVAVMLLVRKHSKIIDKLLHIFRFDIKSIHSTCQIK